MAKNLSVTLAGLSVETRKIIKKISILIKQLEKASLSLIMPREKKAIRAPESEYIIYRLVIPRIKNYASQTMEITY